MNHYDWLEDNFSTFLKNIGLEKYIDYSDSLIVADGDKAYGYESIWEKKGIPFAHGVAIYLISKLPPYNNEVRITEFGWVDPSKWVIINYNRFKDYLPKYK